MFYRFACIVVLVILRLFTRCRVEGLEHVPANGPILLISNHLCLADPPIVSALMPRRIIFMAKEESFRHPLMGPLVRWYGAISVRRGQADRQALRSAESVLRQGGVLGMFPEGTRSKTGQVAKAFPGAAMVAVMASAPVLPVAITGTDLLKSPLSLLSRPKITVRVGKPLTLQRPAGEKTNLVTLTDQMMARVAVMLPEERRGYYSSVAATERE